MGRVWQPYESHLPYLLQLKIDFNLAGMGWLRLAAGRFRQGRAGWREEGMHDPALRRPSTPACRSLGHSCCAAALPSPMPALVRPHVPPPGRRCPPRSRASAAAGPPAIWWWNGSRGQTRCCPLQAAQALALTLPAAPALPAAAPASACGCGQSAARRARGCGAARARARAARRGGGGARGGCPAASPPASWSWMPAWVRSSTASRWDELSSLQRPCCAASHSRPTGGRWTAALHARMGSARGMQPPRAEPEGC